VKFSIANLYLNPRFFYAAAVVILLMILSYSFVLLLSISMAAFVLLVLATVFDGMFVYGEKMKIEARRVTPKVLSLGDKNFIEVIVQNKAPVRLSITIIDELPEQFQVRNFLRVLLLKSQQSDTHVYDVKPLTRGEYHFGDLHCFVSSVLGLVRRKITFKETEMVPVYPSIIQMKRFELKSFIRTSTEYGVKRMQRIGHSYEFEHIKHYVSGDDYRSINWKATGRRAQLMVNQYEDEKSQQVYCLIDKSRVMHMPFDGLSLLDYAVNSSLVISNIVLQKQDKAGLITFSDKIGTALKAERSKQQLKHIIETLYNEQERPVEANYELMYMAMRNFVKGRSLIFLFTNFESQYALQRVLPQLRKINKQHLLVVVFFENTEISEFATKPAETVEDIYSQITAEEYAYNKMQLAQQLKQFGIMSILTKPEHLTVSTINKYLELKSRGLI
jgi:uncharacterized protein (DUF58 family)